MSELHGGAAFILVHGREPYRAAHCEGDQPRVGATNCRTRSDDDRESIRWIVEREEILEPAVDHAFLVVGCDDERDAWLLVPFAHGPAAQPREPGGRERVRNLGPRERAKTRPEQHLRDHGAIVESALDLAAPTSSVHARARRPLPTTHCDPIEEIRTPG